MFRRPAFGGVVLGLVFFWRSLYPTLMPRTWFNQAVITALCVSIGYGLGVLAGRIGHRLLARFGREASPGVKRRAWIVLGCVAAAVIVIYGLVFWVRWQNDQRELVGLDSLSPVIAVPMLLLAAAVTVVLVLIGRAIGKGVSAIDRFNARFLPSAVARIATVSLVAVVAVLFLRDVAFEGFISWANSSFGTFNTTTEEGIEQPTEPTVSGSPASLVPWDTLGVYGRTFVASATTQDALRAFHGADAEVTPPVRVYVGLKSADTALERADLAVKELERAGGFDRDVLVVATSTGTGWLDPPSVTAIEQLHAGSTAFVSMQYSFLPSWISFLVDQDKAEAAGSHLFHAVHERWLELPEDDRPQLIVFGLSLGSFGAEAAFAGVDADASVANMVAKSDGALFVGPPNHSTVWRQLTAEREKASPAWRPVIDGGVTVRFANRQSDLTDLDPSWAAPRVLYYQHPSDPVVFWTMDGWWKRPDWMERPRGYGVPTRGGWFPIVTWVQGVFDLMAGFGAPAGYGHDYTLAYVGAWAQVVPPEGWTSADTVRLEQFLGVA